MKYLSLCFSSALLWKGAVVVATLGGSPSCTPVKAAASSTVPPDALKPQPITDAASALSQTAAIVEATLLRKTSEYTVETGPWTRFEFSDVEVLRGRLDLTNGLVFSQAGGDFPDGRHLKNSRVPDFVEGARYVFFLTNTAWRFTPIVGRHSYRLTEAEGRAFLVDDYGAILLSFTEHGATLSRPAFVCTDVATVADVARVAETPLPQKAASTESVLGAVDVILGRTNLAIGGKFYPQPVLRSARASGVRHAESREIPHSIDAETAPGSPENLPLNQQRTE